MKKCSKFSQQTKENLTSSTFAATGEVAGIAIGTFVTTQTNAKSIEKQEINQETASQKVEIEVIEAHPLSKISDEATIHIENQSVDTQSYTNEESFESNNFKDLKINSQQTKLEVEVISYERITDEHGRLIDRAVINDNGREMIFIDTDLDGEANIVMSNDMQTGYANMEEASNHFGDGVSMVPFQHSVGFNPHNIPGVEPQQVQCDFPDYNNTADTSDFMA